MRRFLVVGHAVPVDGAWGLDDLAGAAGRVDVLCRAVTSALFVSHGIRDDVEVLLAFPAGPVTVRFRGDTVRHLNPDERSTAARIRGTLRKAHDDPWWEEVEPGIDVAPFRVAEALDDVGGTPVVLDADGEAAGAFPFPEEPVFILSDHQPFAPADLQDLADAPRLSLGTAWYHGHSAIAIVHYLLDAVGR